MKRILLVILSLIGIVFALHAVFSYRRYNVILITIDTLRSDYLSCYNPGAQPTPNMDQIAEKGVLFKNAFSLIPITMPAHVSIFTSVQPHKLNLFNNGDRFNHQVPMLTDFLEMKGYTTGAFISLGVLNAAFGLASGFDFYEDDFENTNGRFYKTASEINAAAIPWLEKNRQKRFFAWIHYSDPHEPYVAADAPPDTEVRINGVSYSKFSLAKKEKTAVSFEAKPGETQLEFRALNDSRALANRFLDPRISISPGQGLEIVYADRWITLKLRNKTEVRYFETSAIMKVRNQDSQPKNVQIRFSGGIWDKRTSEVRRNYTAEVQYTDRYIGQLWQKLSDLGLLDRTIIILTSDHGEGLKTHGILGHVDKLWNETTHAPLIIYYPRLGYRGKTEARLANHLDIMPTVLELLHIRNKKPMEGLSLKRSISWSPVDWLFSKRTNRKWTFACTFAPEAALNSFAVTDGKIKVIHTPNKRGWQWEAFDLVADPVEKKNIARIDPRRFASMASLKGLLETHRREAEAAHKKRDNPSLSEEEQQMLRNLGYVGGDTYSVGEQ